MNSYAIYGIFHFAPVAQLDTRPTEHQIKNIKGVGEWGEFSTKPWYEVVHSQEANLEVYTKNESGEIVSKAIVPIKFETAEEEPEI